VSRLGTIALGALVTLGVACAADAPDDLSRRADPPSPLAPTTTSAWYVTPGDGPTAATPPETVPNAPADDPDGLATQVAAGYALAASTVTPEDGARAWLDAVAPYTTPRYQAELEAPTASAASRPEPTDVTLTAIHPVAPAQARWRFEVILTLTAAGDPDPRITVLYVDVINTPVGPRVDGAR